MGHPAFYFLWTVYADIFSKGMCLKITIIVKGTFRIKTNLKCMFLLLKKIILITYMKSPKWNMFPPFFNIENWIYWSHLCVCRHAYVYVFISTYTWKDMFYCISSISSAPPIFPYFQHPNLLNDTCSNSFWLGKADFKLQMLIIFT